MTGTNARIPSVLRFEDTDISIIDRNGRPWLSAADLGRALGYKPVLKGTPKLGAPSAQSGITYRQEAWHVLKLYNRHADEFTGDMTALVDLDTAGGKQQVRVFSVRGCHLIGLFARTARAKLFRRWVLDVLDHLADPPPAPSPPQDEFLSRPIFKQPGEDEATYAARVNDILEQASAALSAGHKPRGVSPEERARNLLSALRRDIDALEGALGDLSAEMKAERKEMRILRRMLKMLGEGWK